MCYSNYRATGATGRVVLTGPDLGRQSAPIDSRPFSSTTVPLFQGYGGIRETLSPQPPGVFLEIPSRSRPSPTAPAIRRPSARLPTGSFPRPMAASTAGTGGPRATSVTPATLTSTRSIPRRRLPNIVAIDQAGTFSTPPRACIPAASMSRSLTARSGSSRKRSIPGPSIRRLAFPWA